MCSERVLIGDTGQIEEQRYLTVPRVAFNREFEIVVPDIGPEVLANSGSAGMIIEVTRLQRWANDAIRADGADPRIAPIQVVLRAYELALRFVADIEGGYHVRRATASRE